ncbi:gluconate 2-dehydrogenase subunit 3 family protein [Thioalkalivibrio sp. XN279]|uniref:gluconate 2-dehydrogenase subunit 3 family protein n=1 Tax=Thioalkalivibrio sp. XN279 TaxID=2714953 RepID=UPI00140CCBB0|nr:gluconate 2-dehydrogenase subunit 3 family protein [Thioalkalivibrio sp. XN279]NHA15939.1 gluconate 2-dehydrogenase subunit 3 family protein [Thioalkalivibrio sp. XN279]
MKPDRGPCRPSGMTRRDFLAASGGVIGTSLMAAHAPALLAAAGAAAKAHEAGAAFLHLDAAEAAALAAVAARVVPSDDTPGAHEAGVIHFIDQAVGSFMSDSAGLLTEGRAGLDARAVEAHGQPFAALDAERQDALLRQIEETPFFGLVHYLTVAGMFALPIYGGNRGYAGWKLIGFDHRHGWAPPFGHYDAAVGASTLGHQAMTGGGHDHD